MFHSQGFFKGSVKTSNNGFHVRRDAKIGSNYQGEGLELRLPQRNREGRIGGFILYRILELSLKIPLQLNCSPCDDLKASKGSSWRSPVVSGGGGGGWGCWGRV